MANDVVTKTLTLDEAENSQVACTLQAFYVCSPQTPEKLRVVLEISYPDESVHLVNGTRRYKDQNGRILEDRSRFLCLDVDKRSLVAWLKEGLLECDPPYEKQILDALQYLPSPQDFQRLSKAIEKIAPEEKN